MKTHFFLIVLTFLNVLLGDNAYAQTDENLTGYLNMRFLEGPDLLFHNANIITLDDQIDRAEALAIKGPNIIAIGTNEEILALATDGTTLVDLEGRTIIPGLTEGHTHQLRLAFLEDGLEGLARASRSMAADGYTTVQETGTSVDLIEACRVLAEEGRLAVRLNAYLSYTNACGAPHENWMTDPITQEKDSMVRVLGVKMFSDGGTCGSPAISTQYLSGGAAGTHGTLFHEQEAMDEMVQDAINLGYPVTTHAMGDSALAIVIRAYEKAFNGNGNQLRCRIEHLKHSRADLADKLAELEIGASIQYSWSSVDSHEYWETLFEEKALPWIYAWGKMRDRGVKFIGGNDAPYTIKTQAMESISILATQRYQRYDETPSYMQGNHLTVEEGIRSMTINPAWYAFEENVKGTITPGKLADLTVLSDDPLGMDPFDVRYIKVEMTVVDGKIRYNKLNKEISAIHDAGKFKVMVNDRNSWGIKNTTFGFLVDDVEQLNRGSFLVSYDTNTVATGTFPQNDFNNEYGYLQFSEPGQIADEEIITVYEDRVEKHPSSLRITQQSFVWNNDPLLLLKYEIKNIGEIYLSEMFVGPMMHFLVESDISKWGFQQNSARYEENDGHGFAYIYSNDNPDAPYIGMTMFDDDQNDLFNTCNYMFGSDIKHQNRERPYGVAFRNGNIQEFTENPGTYNLLLGTGPINIDENEKAGPFWVAIVVGKNLADLKEAVTIAHERQNLITAVDEIDLSSSQKLLLHNYPNPFRDQTEICLDLPDSGVVKLELFDINGNKIKTIINKYMDKGITKFTLTAKNIEPGNYILKLEGKKFRASRKLICLTP